MITEISTTELAGWKENLTTSEKYPALTTTAVIKLTDLQDFIDEISSKANCVNINFVRFTWNEDEPQRRNQNPGAKQNVVCEWKYLKENGKTQVALIFTPATYSEEVNDDGVLVAVGTDIVTDGPVRVLIPGKEDTGPTGHNPPKGKGG